MQVLSLPTNSYQLLVPISMVAQIVGRSNIAESLDINHDHLAGMIVWRDYDVPLIRSSELTGQGLNADQGFERMVILWPMKSASNRAFIALTSMGAPRVIEVDTQQMISMETPVPYSIGVVELDAGLGVIPDISRLSEELYPSAIAPPVG